MEHIEQANENHKYGSINVVYFAEEHTQQEHRTSGSTV